MASFPRAGVIGAGVALSGVVVDLYEGATRWATVADRLTTGVVNGNPNTTIDTLAPTVAGTSEHYFYDYYNRIWVIPLAIDFGTVAVDMTRVFYIWNAYLVQRTLGDITQFETESLTLGGPILPYTMGAMEMLPFDLTASLDGPPTIDGRYEFRFTEGDEVRLPVVGTRSKVWPFPVNWARPFTVSLAYKTEVLTSRRGKEQRRALRSTPRKTLEFMTTVTSERYRALKRMLASWQNKTMVVPEVSRRTRTTEVLMSGATTVTVEDVPVWLQAGMIVVLCNANGYRVALQEVANIDGLNITFASMSAEIWPVGTLIHPGLSGLMVDNLAAQLPVNNTAEIPVRFEVTPGSELADSQLLPPAMFNGRELFTLKPNWSGGIDINFNATREQVDYGHGRIATFLPVNFATQVRQANYLARKATDVEAVAAFVRRMKGQRGEFYVASGQPDLVLMESASIASFEFRVRGQDALHAYKDDPVHRAIQVVMHDGRQFLRTIDTIYGVNDAKGADTIFKVGNEGWPFELTPEDILMVSWLYVCRLGGDEVSFEWLTDEVAQFALTFRTLEDLPSEVLPS